MLSLCRLDLSVFGWLALLASPTSFLKMRGRCVTQLWTGQFCFCVTVTHLYGVTFHWGVILSCSCTNLPVFNTACNSVHCICFHKSPDRTPFMLEMWKNLNITTKHNDLYLCVKYSISLWVYIQEGVGIWNQECFLDVNVSERWKCATLESKYTL